MVKTMLPSRLADIASKPTATRAEKPAEIPAPKPEEASVATIDAPSDGPGLIKGKKRKGGEWGKLQLTLPARTIKRLKMVALVNCCSPADVAEALLGPALKDCDTPTVPLSLQSLKLPKRRAAG